MHSVFFFFRNTSHFSVDYFNMAQESKNNQSEWIELDTSSVPSFAFSYKWCIRNKATIETFAKCDPNTKIVSPLVTNSFTLNKEKINLDWCLEAHPNGHKLLDGSRNLFTLITCIPSQLRANTIEFESLTIKHMVSIPALNIIHFRSDIFKTKNGDKWNTIQTHDNVSKQIFSKYNITKKDGFDIDAKISIQSIKFKYKTKIPSILEQENNLGVVINTHGSGVAGDDDRFQVILNKLEAIQSELKQIGKRMTNISIGDDNINSNNNDRLQNKLEGWILNMFNGHEDIGKEYVRIIMDDEGFDDIDVFCNLNENDLKEMGINKKGHRMKIIQKIKEYNGKKIQSLMKNKNINVKVAPGAALDAQDTEGKE